MNLDMVGMHSDSVINLVLHRYDDAPEDKRIQVLLENREFGNLNSLEIPVNFSSGKTIDINAGELLGLGVVVSYFDWLGEQNGNTYQVCVGVEDSAKAQGEALLSDGAIWHDQTDRKMPMQQVLTQGYFPTKRAINNKDIIEAIADKAKKRDVYPENCGLIVNVYTEELAIDIDELRKEAGDLLTVFNGGTYLVLYKLPSLSQARIINLDTPIAASLTLNLQRHPLEDEWTFNYDKKRGGKPPVISK